MKLDDRIKRYEEVSRHKLSIKTPVILRVDGRAFHTYTKDCVKPFDSKISLAMLCAAIKTSQEMSGFKLAYTQSDECTFYISDLTTYETQAWFDNDINKLVSITSSLFTAYFNIIAKMDTPAIFDCRAFNVPLEEVPNVFIWRQQDCVRNSVQSCARNQFRQKELTNKSISELLEMLENTDDEWSDKECSFKFGSFITGDKDIIDRKLSYDEIIRLI